MWTNFKTVGIVRQNLLQMCGLILNLGNLGRCEKITFVDNIAFKLIFLVYTNIKSFATFHYDK